MEVGGLAVSVVSLTALFQTAVECFDYVQVAKDFGSSVQTSCLLLGNAQLQLTRWGEAMGLATEARQVTDLQNKLSSKDVEQAENLLGHIVHLFEQARDTSNRFGGRSGSTSVVDVADVLAPGNLSLYQRMKAMSVRRQKSTSAGKKIKWALYEKRRLDALVRDARELVDDLARLFPAVTSTAQEQLATDEAAEMQDDPSLAVLKDIIAGQDKFLEEAIARLSAPGANAVQNTWNNRDNTKVNNQGPVTYYGNQTVNL